MTTRTNQVVLAHPVVERLQEGKRRDGQPRSSRHLLCNRVPNLRAFPRLHLRAGLSGSEVVTINFIR